MPSSASYESSELEFDALQAAVGGAEQLADAVVDEPVDRVAGALSARNDLLGWEKHELIADEDWRPVREALMSLYAQPALGHDTFVEIAAAQVWDRSEAYGRGVWAR